MPENQRRMVGNQEIPYSMGSRFFCWINKDGMLY